MRFALAICIAVVRGVEQNSPDREQIVLNTATPTEVLSHSLVESPAAPGSEGSNPYPEGSEPRRILDTIVSILETSPCSTLDEVVTELNENGRFSHILSMVYVSSFFAQARGILAGKGDAVNYFSDCRDRGAVPLSLLHQRDKVDLRLFESSSSGLDGGKTRKNCLISTATKSASCGSSFKKDRRGTHEEGFTKEHKWIIEKVVLADDDIGSSPSKVYLHVSKRFAAENLAAIPYSKFSSIYNEIIIQNF